MKEILTLAMPYILAISAIINVFFVSLYINFSRYDRPKREKISEITYTPLPKMPELNYKAVQSQYNREYYKRNRKKILAQRREKYNKENPKSIFIIVTK